MREEGKLNIKKKEWKNDCGKEIQWKRKEEDEEREKTNYEKKERKLKERKKKKVRENW